MTPVSLFTFIFDVFWIPLSGCTQKSLSSFEADMESASGQISDGLEQKQEGEVGASWWITAPEAWCTTLTQGYSGWWCYIIGFKPLFMILVTGTLYHYLSVCAFELCYNQHVFAMQLIQIHFFLWSFVMGSWNIICCFRMIPVTASLVTEAWYVDFAWY